MQPYEPTDRPWLNEVRTRPEPEPWDAWRNLEPPTPATCPRCEKATSHLCEQHAALVLELL